MNMNVVHTGDRGSESAQQVFSSDNDVLLEHDDRLRPLKLGCLAWLFYKIGCLLILLAMILLVGLVAKFNGPKRVPLDAPDFVNFGNRTE
jgi:hypothetical protein